MYASMGHHYPLDFDAPALALWTPLHPGPLCVHIRTATRWRDVSALAPTWDGHALTFAGDALRERRLDSSAQRATTDWRVTVGGRTVEAHSGRAEWKDGVCTITLVKSKAA